MQPRAFARLFSIPALAVGILSAAACGFSGPSMEQAVATPLIDRGAVRGAPAPFAAPASLLGELQAALAKQSAGKAVSAAPLHGAITVTTRWNDDGALELLWDHSQRGDYNLDGETNISDLAVLGGYFGATSADPVWDEARRADGDGNGALTIADVAAIGQAVGESTAWYALETDNPEGAGAAAPPAGYSAESGWYFVASIPISAGAPNVFAAARSYEHVLADWQPGTYRVVAYDGGGRRGVSGAAMAQSLRGDWWMEGHDQQHTSLSAHAGPETGHIAWSLNLDGAGWTSPVLDALGNVYVGADAGLSCVSPSGDVKWTFGTPSGVASTPAIGHNGYIYFGCSDGVFRALKPGGELAWVYNAGGDIHSATAIGPDGRIYFGCADAKLYCLKPDGTLAWTWASPGGGEYWRKAVSFDLQGRIIVAGATDEFYGYDTRSEVYLLNPDGTQARSEKLMDALDTPLITSLVMDNGGEPVPVAITSEPYGGAWGFGGIRATRLDPGPDWTPPPAWQNVFDFEASGYTPALLPGVSGLFYARDVGIGFLDLVTNEQAAFLEEQVRYCGPTVIDNRGVCYVASRSDYGSGDNVIAMHADGSLEWSRSLHSTTVIRPALDASTLYLVLDNGIMAIGGVLSGLVPETPKDLWLTSSGSSSIRISWHSTNGADAYEVYRVGTSTPITVKADYSFNIPDGTVYEYTDKDLSPGTSYSYYVVATNRIGSSAPSPTATASTRLEQVQGVSASDGTYASQIVVSWEKVANATGYRIYRENVNNPPIAEVGDVDSFADTSITDWNAHNYAVSAFNAQTTGATSASDAGSITRGSGHSGPGEWAMHDHDLAQTRRSTVLGPAAQPAIVVDTQVGNSSLTLLNFADDGAAICGLSSGGGAVYNADGTLRYTYPASFYYSSIAPDGAIVCHAFRSDSSPMLTVLNPNGTLRSQYETLNVYAGSPLGGGDYIGAEPFAVSRFDLGGNVAWRYVLPEFARSPKGYPPLVAADGSVYFATGSKVQLSGTWPNQGPPGPPGGGGGPVDPPPTNYVYALNPDGSFKWRYEQAGFINETALGNDGTVYISTYNGSPFTTSTTGRVIAIAGNGSETWDYAALEVNRMCIAADGKLVFSYADGVTALNPDGSVAWDYVTDVWTSDLLLDAASNSYFFTAAEDETEADRVAVTLHSLDAAGGERWSLLLDAQATQSLALRDNGALVCTMQRNVSGAYNARFIVLK